MLVKLATNPNLRMRASPWHPSTKSNFPSRLVLSSFVKIVVKFSIKIFAGQPGVKPHSRWLTIGSPRLANKVSRKFLLFINFIFIKKNILKLIFGVWFSEEFNLKFEQLKTVLIVTQNQIWDFFAILFFNIIWKYNQLIRPANVAPFVRVQVVDPNDYVCFQSHLRFCSDLRLHWFAPFGHLDWWCSRRHCRVWHHHACLGSRWHGSNYGAQVVPPLSFFYHTFVGMRHWSWDIFAVGIKDMNDTLPNWLHRHCRRTRPHRNADFFNFRENFWKLLLIWYQPKFPKKNFAKNIEV